jgi:pyruvate/2-oxoglutarate/acetoin dehydrogenase E1 component/pyruvate/2-oxoglutarate dehydrogenase complex dihydrolipoamide acyltransferase (E2) component
MMPLNERVVQNINRALYTLLECDDQAYVIGQDIADPYGGAFGVTRRLSTKFPDRVLSTPISESGIIGVANGLALCGNKVIVEVMFGDFTGLVFDELLNFTSKAVGMYGQKLPMPVIVRCPVGGNRGYGPTHSQNPQKHFIGIPHLSLYEISPFHDAELLLAGMMERKAPAILFEPKTLYPQRVYRNGKVDDLLVFDFLDGGDWVHVYPAATTGPEIALLATGGMVERAIKSAHLMATEDEIRAHILTPSRLYPVDIDPIMDVLGDVAAVCIAEESNAGGTWGTEAARYIHERMWDRLAHPVLMINSRDSIIPAAPHLERKVLVDSEEICLKIRSIVTAARPARPMLPSSGGRATPAASPHMKDMDRARSDYGLYAGVTIPKLNSNDVTYVLLGWLADDGREVQAGDHIAEIETSKAIEELAAPESGILRHDRAPGTECNPGDTIARIFVHDGTGARSEKSYGSEIANSEMETPDASLTRRLSWNQVLVAETVSTSHRDIPDAFVVVQAEIDPVLRLQRAISEGSAESLELLDVLVMAVASLEEKYPTCFGGLLDASTMRLPDGAHVGITFDAGNGLFIPVVRSAERRTGPEVSDQIAAFKLQAIRGTFSEADLSEPNIVISWNYDPNVSLVKAIIPPGLACVVSIGGPRCELSLGDSGQPAEKTVVNLGLTHDHRIVNGREAAGFLREIAGILGDEDRLAALTAG